MAIRSDEIGEILKQRIASFEAPVVDANEGVITSVNDAIARSSSPDRAAAAACSASRSTCARTASAR
jgi:F0F1-type ATP synthase alpha subunit